jgi:hypothetical protein
MSVETLCDFFLFLSSDKKRIISKNLIDFYIFIKTKNYLFDEQRKTISENFDNNKQQSLEKGLELLLLEFLLFFYKNSSFDINKSQEKKIQNKIEERKIIEKQKDDEILEEQKNSYQYYYKKNLTQKQIYDDETKKCLLNFLLDGELKINISPENYILFFNKHEKYRILVYKFIYKMKPLIEEKSKLISNKHLEKKSNINNNSMSNLEKIGNKNKINQISEKELLIQDKDQFVNILNKVKVNIIKKEENKINDLSEQISNKKKNFEKPKEIFIDEDDDIQFNFDDIKNYNIPYEKKIIKNSKINKKKERNNNNNIKEKIEFFETKEFFDKKTSGTPDNKIEDIPFSLLKKENIDLSKEIILEDITKKNDKSADDIKPDTKRSLKKHKFKTSKLSDKFGRNENKIQCDCYLF